MNITESPFNDISPLKSVLRPADPTPDESKPYLRGSLIKDTLSTTKDTPQKTNEPMKTPETDRETSSADSAVVQRYSNMLIQIWKQRLINAPVYSNIRMHIKFGLWMTESVQYYGVVIWRVVRQSTIYLMQKCELKLAIAQAVAKETEQYIK